jgi:peptidoglycan hydrolase CwlO-like protein
MWDTLLISILLILIMVNVIPKLFPIIEGNTGTSTSSEALATSQKAAGTIQQIKDQFQKVLDALGGDINDLYTQLDDDVNTNTQNVSDYNSTVSQNTDPYASGAYSETGNAT